MQMHDQGHPNRWKILVVMCLALVVTGLDSLIVTVALPSIQHQLGATVSQAQWVVSSYSLAFAAPILFAGGMIDRFGRRVGFLTGMVVLLAGSLVCALADAPGVLIAGRILMGVGAAVIMPATLSLIRHVFPPNERAKAMGAWVGVAALGVPLGPVVGGLLLQQFWWGSVFMVNIPLVVLAIIGCLVFIPESKNESHPGLDWVGFLVSSVALLLLVDAIIEAPERGWASVTTWALLLAGLLGIAAFVAWERRTDAPMLQPDVLRSRSFGAPLITIGSFTFAMFGTLFAVMMYLQFVLGYGPLKAGLHLLAMCTMMISAPLGTQLPSKFGLSKVSAVGLALVALALLVLAFGSEPSSLRVIAGIAMLGVGAGLTTAPSTNSVMESAPAEQTGAGSATADVAFQLGGALGIAVLGSVLTTTYRNTLALVPGAGDAEASISAAVRASEGMSPGAAAHLMKAASDAFAEGMSAALYVGSFVSLLGALLGLVLLPGHTRAVSDESAD